MDFRNPHFADPVWLLLATLGPICVVLLHLYAARQRKRQLSSFAAPGLLDALTRSHSPGRRLVKNLMLVVAFAVMGVAMARPQWGERTEVSEAMGEDVLFLLDSSKSMLASDMQPNRLSRSKYAILNFVQQHGRGRVGLVAFAGQAFLQCPLTFDYDAFRESLLAVDEKTIPVPGTDIGRALDEGYRAMEKNQRRKILVLVTDGEDLEKSGLQTAQALASKGIVVYTVGVGTAAGSLIRTMNEQGGMDFLKDPQGNLVQSRLDEQTLTAIAQVTRGTYQPLGPLGEGLTRVQRLIDGSADSSGVTRLKRMGVDRFHVFVGAVIVFLVIESLIGMRRRVSQTES